MGKIRARQHGRQLDRPVRTEIEEDDGVVFEGSVSSDESMIQAIAIITDWSGIAPEYAYGTERPVIYLDIPQKVVNEQFAELELEPNEVTIRKGFGIIVLPEEIPNMATYIKQAVSEREKFREKIIEMRNANLFHFGKSSKIGAEHILDVVKTHKVN